MYGGQGCHFKWTVRKKSHYRRVPNQERVGTIELKLKTRAAYHVSKWTPALHADGERAQSPPWEEDSLN